MFSPKQGINVRSVKDNLRPISDYENKTNGVLACRRWRGFQWHPGTSTNSSSSYSECRTAGCYLMNKFQSNRMMTSDSFTYLGPLKAKSPKKLACMMVNIRM